MTNLELPDGRTLEYVVDGPAEGLPMVLHHGTPSAAVLFEPMVSAAARHGLRTVMHSRPGYAGSSARPGRSVASVAGDVAAVLDELGADRFVTVGWSGGGPHVLACAALLPERCLAAASIAGVAPYDGEGLDWLAGMGAENIEEFGAAAAGEATLTAYLQAAAPGLAGVQPADIAAALGDLVSEVDRKALTGAFAENVADTFRASVTTGIAGWRDDDLAILGDWGYRLADIRIPVSIWQGGEDRMVPFDHGRWLAAHLPAATVHLDPAEGHLSLMLNHFDAIVAELTAHVR
ncbi:MAG TPA: alpha/beta hydrolase [Actinoplanes sp.]|nr:alpha/beta hydrolase [Actinoplanes sp.]